MNVLIYRVLIISIFFTFSLTNLFAETKENCTSLYNQSSKFWIKQNITDITFEIAFQKKFSIGCRLLVFVDQKDFKPENLRKIGQKLFYQYKRFGFVDIAFDTSRDMILGDIWAFKNDKRGVEELTTLEYKNVPKEDTPNTESFQARYFQGKNSEWLAYDIIITEKGENYLISKRIDYKKNGILLIKN